MITPALLRTHNPFPSCLTSSLVCILRAWWNWISMDLPNLVIRHCIHQTLVLRDSFCCLVCSRLFFFFLRWLSENDRAVYNSQGGDPFLRGFYCGCLQCYVKTKVLRKGVLLKGCIYKVKFSRKLFRCRFFFFLSFVLSLSLYIWLASVSGWLRGGFSFYKGGGWGSLCGACHAV